jgi:hypothetical protein
MIDNFQQISKFLTFDSSDDFYYCQIIARRKENPNLKTNNSGIKTYTIRSLDYLELRKDEIITLCKLHNARAYINLNKRSFEKCAYHSMKKLTDVILAKSFTTSNRIFDTVASSKFTTVGDKKWLIDIDNQSLPSPLMLAHIEHNCNPKDPNKILGVIQTLNGCHVITKPFNMLQFKEKYPDVDVKKNSPTLLFY